MNCKIHILNALLLLVFPACALAQQRVDPFLSETEGAGTFEEELSEVKKTATDSVMYTGARAELSRVKTQTEQQQRFSSSMQNLLKNAGVDPYENTWADFEDASGTPAEENYRSSMEWRIKEELSRPLPSNDPFGNKLDYIEEKLKEFRSQNADDIEKEMRRYQGSGEDDLGEE